MKKLYLFSLLVFFFCSLVRSQNNNATSNPPKKKEHYRIIVNGTDDPLWYEKAMTKADLDSLRFLDSRRHIPIQGTSMVLELYSAQELFELYGKPISLLTVKDAAKARKIKVKLNSQGSLTVIE